MTTILELLRQRLTENPSDETRAQTLIELLDAVDWLENLKRLPAPVRLVAISFPSIMASTSENDEAESDVCHLPA